MRIQNVVVPFGHGELKRYGTQRLVSTSSVSFTVRLTPSDLYRLQLWVVLRGSRSVWIMPVLLVLLTVNTLRWNAQEQETPTLGFGYLAGLIGLWIVLLLVIPCFIIRSRFKNEKGLHEDTRYTISQDRIDMESATASFRFDWSRIVRAVETRRYFYLFVSKTPTFIIPKRCVLAGTEINDLRKILRGCVRGKAQLLS
jgi:hypothetical protein